ncbi:MAG: hypothetical protein LWX01_10450 [Deltaproteobacteria bacterium]|nr:hypothetical protein [Deltaproteobacteria bacterium]MDL1962094.1 hypothetical protein [Deltaproteobacteria bacterium]
MGLELGQNARKVLCIERTGPAKTGELVGGRSRPYFNGSRHIRYFSSGQKPIRIYFLHDFIIFLDIGYLGTVMLYLMMALYCLVTKKDWTTALQQHMNEG